MNINTLSPPASEGTIPDTSRIEVVKETKETLSGIQQQSKNARQSGAGGNKESMQAEEIRELAESLNEYMDSLQTQLGFSINDKLNNNKVIVEIKNRKTDELIKQVPAEEIVEIREKMAELTGLLFDNLV